MVERLMERVEGLEGVPYSLQRLVFSGKRLVPGRVLSDYSIKGGSTLHLLLSLHGGFASFNFQRPLGGDPPTAFSGGGTRHPGVTCDGRLGCWGAEIKGTRHKCLQCHNTDFCESCASLHASTGHLVAPITDPLDPTQSAMMDVLLKPLQLVSANGHNFRVPVDPSHVAAVESHLHSSAPLVPTQVAQDTLALGRARMGTLESLHKRAVAGTTSTLDPRFFTLVGADTVTTVSASQMSLQAYYTLHDTVFLMDKRCGHPIAALQVMPSQLATTGTAQPTTPASAILSRGNHTLADGHALSGFQAMFSSQAHFAFVFTNLLPDASLAFFLRACNSEGGVVSEAPINGVNIARPGESLVCNANSLGHALLIQEAIDATTGGTISHAQERARPVAAQVGDYQSLSVHFMQGLGAAGGTAAAPGVTVPPSSLLGSNFVWETSDNFLRRMPLLQPSAFGFGGFFGASGAPGAIPIGVTSLFGAAGGGGVARGGGFSNPPSAPAFFPNTTAQPPTSALLNSSTVARLGTGDVVPGYNPGQAYDGMYEATPCHTTRLVLGLSLQPELAPTVNRGKPCYSNVLSELIRKVGQVRSAEGTPVLQTLPPRVFLSPQCVVCLEEGNPPDCIFFPCGHQCAHFDETEGVDVCFVCRGNVSARLCVRGGVVVKRAHINPRAQAPSIIAQYFSRNPSIGLVAKPVIYLYPVEPTACKVSLTLLEGEFTALLPVPEDFAGESSASFASWGVTAQPGGLLQHSGGEEAHPPVSSLFWESTALFKEEEVGFDATTLHGSPCSTTLARLKCIRTPPVCLPGARVGQWLFKALARLGLTPAEYTECVTFWGPRMAHHPFVVVSFLSQGTLEARAPLTVTPVPERVLRVMLLLKGVGVMPEGLMGEEEGLPERCGGSRQGRFWAVEWGGVDFSS